MAPWTSRGRSQRSTLMAIGAILMFYYSAANIRLLQQHFKLLRHNSTSAEGGSRISPYLETTISTPDNDPLTRLDLRLGRWDASRAYKTFDYAAVGDLYSEASAIRHVCLATQSSIESLPKILKIAAHWTGPISVAAFVVEDEMRLLKAFATWLFRCQPRIYSRLAIHVATPADRLAVFGTMPDWALNCSAQPLLSDERQLKTDAGKASNPYPQNLLRNLARKNCHTPYVYLVDVDIVPSKGMAESLDQFLLSIRKCKLCAYVIPTYELDWSVANFPSNKSELLQLAKKNLAVPFHKKVFIYNQLSSNLRKWEASRGIENNDTHISHDVTSFKLLYEPFYVPPDNVPAHDERFVGYGFTRNSQVYEMFLLGYQFKVLSPIFTIHWGLQSAKPPKWRRSQISENSHKFTIFKKELFAKYGKDPLGLFTKKLRVKNTKKKFV